MAFRLRAREAPAAGMRRIVTEQLDAAVRSLRGASPGDRHAAVHEARKACKRARAALRLARSNIGAEAYRRDNAGVRDAAARLAGVRDAAVVHEALEALVATATDPKAHAGVAHHLGRRDTTVSRAALASTADRLEAVRAGVGAWDCDGDGHAFLTDGLRRVYDRGRSARDAAAQAATSAHLHEWRKQAKYLWHALEVVRPAWSPVLGPLAKQTHRLCDVLGDDHDLAVLGERLPEPGSVASVPTSFGVLLDHRRGELQAQAWSLGARLYADSAKSFSRRLDAWLSAWRDHPPPPPQP